MVQSSLCKTIVIVMGAGAHEAVKWGGGGLEPDQKNQNVKPLLKTRRVMSENIIRILVLLLSSLFVTLEQKRKRKRKREKEEN